MYALTATQRACSPPGRSSGITRNAVRRLTASKYGIRVAETADVSTSKPHGIVACSHYTYTSVDDFALSNVHGEPKTAPPHMIAHIFKTPETICTIFGRPFAKRFALYAI